MNEWQNLAPSWMRCQLNHNQSLGCCRGWWRCCSFCMGSDQQSIHRKQVNQQFWMKMWFSISCKSLSDLLCCTTFLDDFCLFLGLSHQSWTTWMLEFVHRELSPGSLPVSWYQILGLVKYYHPDLQNHCGYILFSTSTVTMWPWPPGSYFSQTNPPKYSLH